MKRRLKNGVWVLLALGVGCTNQPPVQQTQSLPSATPSCADGGTPVVLEGAECPGAWTIRNHAQSQQSVCTYVYGPAIRCPEGTRSTSYEAVCYGEITKTDFHPETIQDCEKKLGKSPRQGPYQLICCPK